jgi:hypothetical protein
MHGSETCQDIFVVWKYERKKPFGRLRHVFQQGCKNLGDKIAKVTKFGTVAP